MEADQESFSQRILQLEQQMTSLSQMAMSGSFQRNAMVSGQPIQPIPGNPAGIPAADPGILQAGTGGLQNTAPSQAMTMEDRLQERFKPEEVTDLKNFADQWIKIRSSLPSVLMKKMLKHSRISVMDDSSKILLFFDENQDASAMNAKTYFTGSSGSKLKELSALVSDYLGREVSFECFLEDHSDTASQRIDLESIQEKIHMEITVE